MPKKKARASSPTITTPQQRVCWLLQAIWKGNRSAMARALGVSHTAIFKVEAGERQPGRQILEALSSDPRVNPVWLMTGEGEPLLADRGKSPSAAGWPVPIADRLLPGMPAQHAGLLTGESRAVGEADYGEGRYWYRLQASDLITSVPDEATKAGDLMLLEADPAVWQENLRWLDGRICGLAVGGPSSGMLALVRVIGATHTDAGSGYSIRVQSFGGDQLVQDFSPPPEKSLTSTTKMPPRRIRPPGIDTLDEAFGIANPEQESRAGTTEFDVEVDEIVAVAVQLVRPL